MIIDFSKPATPSSSTTDHHLTDASPENLLDNPSPYLRTLETIMLIHEDDNEPCNIGILMRLSGRVDRADVEGELRRFVRQVSLLTVVEHNTD
jgi:hypothetical protein